MSAAKLTWTTIGAIVGVLVLVFGIYALTVALSGPKGQGDAIIKKNSAQNWTQAQQDFERIYADVESTKSKIILADEAAKSDPMDQVKYTNAEGLKSYCLSQVADYNAKSRSYLTEDFKSIDLPAKLDPSYCGITS